MPGPISESYDPWVFSKKKWKEHIKTQGLKFFVLKCEDFLDAITEDEADTFNEMLAKMERARQSLGKVPANKYWVVNRDEPYADKVKRIIEENEKITLED